MATFIHNSKTDELLWCEHKSSFKHFETSLSFCEVILHVFTVIGKNFMPMKILTDFLLIQHTLHVRLVSGNFTNLCFKLCVNETGFVFAKFHFCLRAFLSEHLPFSLLLRTDKLKCCFLEQPTFDSRKNHDHLLRAW